MTARGGATIFAVVPPFNQAPGGGRELFSLQNPEKSGSRNLISSATQGKDRLLLEVAMESPGAGAYDGALCQRCRPYFGQGPDG